MDRAEREHPRYAHEASVVVRVADQSVEGRTHNLSRGGLCAVVADPVPVGVDCEVDISLVFDDDAQSEPLRLPARTVWCTALDDGQQVGLSFRPIDAEQAEYLALFLRYLDDGRALTVKGPRTRDLEIDKRFG